jgi:3,4-dihydroxy 2-butanone 4-phosphate synthase/GTP cyclohydrolase II
MCRQWCFIAVVFVACTKRPVVSDAVNGAIAALRAGLPVLVADDHDRENEADVVLAAETTSAEWVAWTIRMTSGLLCAPLTAELAQELSLPQMVSDNQDPKSTAYTVSVDAREGVTTGISARDRCRTLEALADPRTTPHDLIRPGHVFPLRARSGGVLERPGHTEAAVDLCQLAGLRPVAAIAELVTDTGEMMRMHAAEELGRRLDLPVLTIAELVRFRQASRRTFEVIP